MRSSYTQIGKHRPGPVVGMEKHVRTFLHDCEKKCFPVDCWDAKIGNAQKIPSQ